MSRTPSSYGTVFRRRKSNPKPSAIDRSSLVLFVAACVSIGRVAHFNGRSICFSTSLQIFVGKIAGATFGAVFVTPKVGPPGIISRKLYIYFLRGHFWGRKTDPFFGPTFWPDFCCNKLYFSCLAPKKNSMKQISRLPKRH